MRGKFCGTKRVSTRSSVQTIKLCDIWLACLEHPAKWDSHGKALEGHPEQ